jgi:hypothetical protein
MLSCQATIQDQSRDKGRAQVIVYQLLAHGRWFSPGTLASSTTKTDRHDMAEILLKVALKHQKSNQIIFYNFDRQLECESCGPFPNV